MSEHHDTTSTSYVKLWIMLTQPWFLLQSIELALVVWLVLKLREEKRDETGTSRTS